MKTRREFIQTSMMGVAASWTLPTFLSHTMMSMDMHAADSRIQVGNGKNDPILVILQLGGGNDGLNTIVPFDDDEYYKARPNISLKKTDVLKINNEIAFNPKLAEFKSLYDNGEMALINGVGYPNPNRSHFRSMEIWHTASDSNINEHHGWLGRYFDNACQGADPSIAVNVGGTSPRAFLSKEPTGISLANPDQYRLLEAEEDGANETYDKLRRDMALLTGDGDAGASIGEIGGGASADMNGNNLDFLSRTQLDAEVSSDRIHDIVKKYKPQVQYPNGRLSRDLQLISRLIGGQLGSRIYYVSQGGYDTHANQKGSHDRLMTELSGALGAFCKDLKEQGNWDRVMIVSFSEFGRRVKENASGGTDHGVAGPMMAFGGAVKPGLYGKYPSLTDLDKGDLKHNVDFRTVYATMLEKWLKTDSQPVLKGSFSPLDFIKTA